MIRGRALLGHTLINVSVTFVCYTHVNRGVVVAHGQVIVLQAVFGVLVSLDLQMFAFVEPEALRAAEAPSTDVAAIRSLPSVKPEVVLETRSSRETLLALRTVVPLPRVDFLMFPQAARLVEAAVAHRAVIRPLARVREPVSVHGARVGKTLPAVGTGKGFLSGVHLLVAFELAFLGELFPTQAALVGFLS